MKAGFAVQGSGAIQQLSVAQKPIAPENGGTVAGSNTIAPESGRESVLVEAQRLVHGDRNAAYGNPLDDMDRTAGMVSAMLGHKLKSPITAEDIALIMCQVKISRQINKPKRDNCTDLAGYAECLDWIIEERKERG